jgi:tellurite resistance protein TerC
MSSETIYFLIFTVGILAVLFFDLTVIGRHHHVLTFKESLIWTGVWVSLALMFYFFILFKGDVFHNITSMEHLLELQSKYAPHLKLDLNSFENSLDLYRNNMAMEFISGYIIEYTLSMDNVFVMMLILSSFAVEERYYKEVLFWGILGAIVLRFFFIFVGAALIAKFSWILLLFGAFLIFTGVKLFVNRNEEEDKAEKKDHWLVKFFSKHFNVLPDFVGGKFFVRQNKKTFMTPLFVVLILIEFTDLIFATDSIPAIFAVTRDPYLVFFSNIFAIIGLRSLFFLLMKVMNLFHYLNYGIAFLLTFVGFKLLFHRWLEKIGFSSAYSLYVILGTLVLCIIASLLFPKKEANTAS